MKSHGLLPGYERQRWVHRLGLEGQGAIVLERIEDPSEGHGALKRNAANARRVIDLFAGK